MFLVLLLWALHICISGLLFFIVVITIWSIPFQLALLLLLVHFVFDKVFDFAVCYYMCF